MSSANKQLTQSDTDKVTLLGREFKEACFGAILYSVYHLTALDDHVVSCLASMIGANLGRVGNHTESRREGLRFGFDAVIPAIVGAGVGFWAGVVLGPIWVGNLLVDRWVLREKK